MNKKAPGLKIRLQTFEGMRPFSGSDTVVKDFLEPRLCQVCGWTGRPGGTGWAMTRLFARLMDLVFDRLNRLPDKNFLAFLDVAGVELLAPRCASTDLAFVSAPDGSAYIEVPRGTQVATAQTETRPEVVFETLRDLVVVPNSLVKCFAFDQIFYSDRTLEAQGEGAGLKSFAAFAGETERERWLFIGDALLSFQDDLSRKNATITIDLTMNNPGKPAKDGGWIIQWYYWDGTGWKVLPGRCIEDNTGGFQRNGTIRFSDLPAIAEDTVFGETEGVSLACCLKGGYARAHLPILAGLAISRTVEINKTSVSVDAAFHAVQSGVAYVPLDITGEFYPLGVRPVRLDTFYLRADEALIKGGGRAGFHVDLAGLPRDINDSTEIDRLRVSWEYHGGIGWMRLGESSKTGMISSSFGFLDTTCAFTRTGKGLVISFTVPDDMTKTRVNDMEGYWIRARVTAGSFDEPGGMIDGVWNQPRTHAPLVTSLDMTLEDYAVSSGNPDPVDHIWSRVDGMAENLAPYFAEGRQILLFSARDEGPALYLGFKAAFPAGKWIQILVDVDQTGESWTETTVVYWEYWDGSGWSALRISDGTSGLTQRGYVGFFAPDSHRPAIEFGEEAYWLRVRPHNVPVAHAGSDIFVDLSGDQSEAVVELDASMSGTSGGEDITRYIWRPVSTSTLIARAGDDMDVLLPEGKSEAVVELDAFGSKSLYGRTIRRYRWRLVSGDVPAMSEKDTESVSVPYLRAVRINTVPAENALTVRDETLGSSNGEPCQSFSLLRSPVLPGIELVVREPDLPPEDELNQLVKELGLKDSAVVFPVSQTGEGEKGVWVRWYRVRDFYSSGPASRHFVLDPITGVISFGNGVFGKIPPVGRDNIRVLSYRSHNGAAGNVPSCSVTVLRNPSGDLQNIKSVTNPEDASSGSDAETVDALKERGPQYLKHRERAVTVEDFQWLALEASGEVAQARCLPGLNPSGISEPGWVTVVITPKSRDKRPCPTLALVRTVRSYLEKHALMNLSGAGRIYVKGPEYIEVVVRARVAASIPEKADEVELAVLRRLEGFFHPLTGGPDARGWELGRDVYISEISAEIEAVEGVDHLAAIRLGGSIQQFYIYLGHDGDDPVTAPFDLPCDSEVSTFDERVRFLLERPVPEGKSVLCVTVRGFRQDNRVCIVGEDNSVLKDNLKVALLVPGGIIFDRAFDPVSLGAVNGLAVMSLDARIRMPIVEGGLSQETGGLVRAELQGLAPGDTISLVAGRRRDAALEFIPVKEIVPCEDRVFVPAGCLVCSGDHDIEMILDP